MDKANFGRLDARYKFKEGATTLADGATTFALTGYEHYITANTGATVIINITGGRLGMTVCIHAGDNNTGIADNENITLQSGRDLASEDFPENSQVTLWYNGSVWVQQGLWVI